MKIFRIIKRFISRFIVDYKEYELSGQHMIEKIVYLDGDERRRYYTGSCTVWYTSNLMGMPLKRCNVFTEERLFGVWNEMKYEKVWKIKIKN